MIQPSLPGTENFCLSALVAEPAEAMPTRVRTTQKVTTMRLCASTQRVSARDRPVLGRAPALRGAEYAETAGRGKCHRRRRSASSRVEQNRSGQNNL